MIEAPLAMAAERLGKALIQLGEDIAHSAELAFGWPSPFRLSREEKQRKRAQQQVRANVMKTCAGMRRRQGNR